uniref:AAA_34 domain-containing protein n=1 Tax=Steinernema glaseri TaxID=37863 RepID=A0A1I7YKS0_9BILA
MFPTVASEILRTFLLLQCETRLSLNESLQQLSTRQSTTQLHELSGMQTPKQLEAGSKRQRGCQKVASCLCSSISLIHVAQVGTLNNNMKWALFGQRLGFCVFDLDITKEYMNEVQRMAADVGQYSHTEKWQDGTLTNTKRERDILLSSKLRRWRSPLLESSTRIRVCAGLRYTQFLMCEKMCENLEIISTLNRYVDLHDMPLEPNYVTYLIPGNDDSTTAIRYYTRMFCDAINRGKNARHGIEMASSEKLPSLSMG